MSDLPDRPPAITVSKDVLTAHLAGEAVLLHLETKQYYRLNETGAFIWARLEEGIDPAAISTRLVEHFDVDMATAEAELHHLLAELRARHLVVES